MNFIRAYQTDRFNEFMFLNNPAEIILKISLLMAEQKTGFIPDCPTGTFESIEYRKPSMLGP